MKWSSVPIMLWASVHSDKLQFYNDCFNTIEQYCKDENWTSFVLCKSPTYPEPTSHDAWIQKFMIQKINAEHWRNDQILIDSVSHGHHDLFRSKYKFFLRKYNLNFPIQIISNIRYSYQNDNFFTFFSRKSSSMMQ